MQSFFIGTLNPRKQNRNTSLPKMSNLTQRHLQVDVVSLRTQVSKLYVEITQPHTYVQLYESSVLCTKLVRVGHYIIKYATTTLQLYCRLLKFVNKRSLPTKVCNTHYSEITNNEVPKPLQQSIEKRSKLNQGLVHLMFRLKVKTIFGGLVSVV